MFSPLEQFYVFFLFDSCVQKCSVLLETDSRFVLWLGLFVNSMITNFSIEILVGLVFFFIFFVFFFRRDEGDRFFVLFFHPVRYFVGYYYNFLTNLMRENISVQTFRFVSYLFFLFTFLLFFNLIGMIPYSFAVTSHFILTFFFSSLTFFLCVLLGSQLHGLYFFSLFLPNGAPFVLIPFLVVIELISFSARWFSLAIRLFANIMSGHTLLKILATFVWLLLAKFATINFFFLFSLILVITGLEIVIALLQAYVFSVLTAVYINEAVVLH